MPKARFKIDFLDRKEISPFGNKIIEFKIAVNTGVDFGTIEDSASGGELSRIILAIKSLY